MRPLEISVPTKRCSTCMRRLLLERFYENYAKDTGREARCIECYRTHYRDKYRAKNRPYWERKEKDGS